MARPPKFAVPIADCLLVGAVLSWGGYIAVSKPLVQRHDALPALAGTFLVGCLLSIPVALLVGPAWPAFGQVSPSAWLALGVLSLIITPFGWAFQNLALSRFDASEVATFSNGSPILTIIWGIWLFDEVLTVALIAGGALTLGGMYWASRPRSSYKMHRRRADGNPVSTGDFLATVFRLSRLLPWPRRARLDEEDLERTGGGLVIYVTSHGLAI